MHPGRGEPQVLEQFPPLVSRKRHLQVIAPFPRYVLLAQLAEGLDKQAAHLVSNSYVFFLQEADISCVSTTSGASPLAGLLRAGSPGADCGDEAHPLAQPALSLFESRV